MVIKGLPTVKPRSRNTTPQFRPNAKRRHVLHETSASHPSPPPPPSLPPLAPSAISCLPQPPITFFQSPTTRGILSPRPYQSLWTPKPTAQVIGHSVSIGILLSLQSSQCLRGAASASPPSLASLASLAFRSPVLCLHPQGNAFEPKRFGGISQ